MRHSNDQRAAHDLLNYKTKGTHFKFLGSQTNFNYLCIKSSYKSQLFFDVISISIHEIKRVITCNPLEILLLDDSD